MRSPILRAASAPSRLRRFRNGGFALVITLSLMILLTVVAVGLLSLSSISLRSSSQGQALSTAKSNARLALMLAIGELQKSAGPDQRITARADVIDEKIANPRLTGVWKSREITAATLPVPSDYSKTERDKKFVGWLASSADSAAAADVGFAAKSVTNPVTLWGKGSLGATAPVADLVTAAKVTTPSGRGAFAWAVMDEGVKVRINTPYLNDATTAGMKTAQLGAGRSPDLAMLPGLGALKREFLDQKSSQFVSLGKGISRLNFGLAADQVAEGTGSKLMPLTHDISLNSTGLFTDTASGGLKEDFQLLTNITALPSPYLGKGVYVSRLGMTNADAVSDPRWESLQQFARLYRDKVVNSGGVPFIRSQVPAGWSASLGSNPTTGVPGTIQRKPPAGVILMPTVAKVQIVFSMLARDIYSYSGTAGSTIPETSSQLHGPWGDNFRNSSYDYLLHLLYTPVVTLHNPYDVAIEFTNMKVVFSNVPFAMQVFRNGQAQSRALVPLELMYLNSENGNSTKNFGMTLKTKTSTNAPGSPTFRLLPGEVKMFSPYIPATRSWAEENGGTRIFSDWDHDASRTLNMEGIPGWRGDGIGFDLDWFCPSSLRVDGSEHENGRNMDRGGCIGMRRQDEFHFLFAPLSYTALSKSKFVVEMFASSGNSSSPVSSGAIEMDYESPTGLQDLLIGKGATLRFPKTGTLKTLDMLDHSSLAIKKYTKVRPFALLSARAKTTSGGRDSSNEDGRFATKPWCFAHANIGAVSQKVVSDQPANQSHEIDLQLLESGTANLLQVDSQDRGNFITGNSGFNGVKFGAQYDIPLAPLQTLTQLNSANPGGSSGYLPRFAQPIGNSWAHPLMSTDKVIETGTGGKLLDHSFLLNSALYDHFYFSGLADQTGPFSSGKATADLTTQFAEGRVLDDPRLQLYTPDGKESTSLADEVSKPSPQTRIAAWQMMQGAFNVNSTSVAAWKAMLGSIRDSQAIINALNKTTNSTTLTNLQAVDADESRISRFRLPPSASAAQGADAADAYWLGPREYSDSQLQKLAEKIVEQVRERGPFLSMSEFVNRQLGPASDDKSQRGALQQAIDNADLNKDVAADANAGYEIPQSAITSYKYANPAAGAGSSFQGAPGYLSQADILGVLGNAATPRSDTFTVRCYGEARDTAGKILASATCEAILQRVPDYMDSADTSEIAPANLTRDSNKIFGRRFQMVSFRWLSSCEV